MTAPTATKRNQYLLRSAIEKKINYFEHILFFVVVNALLNRTKSFYFFLFVYLFSLSINDWSLVAGSVYTDTETVYLLYGS